MKKNLLIFLLIIFSSNYVFATYDITKDIKIDKEKFSLKWNREDKDKDKDKNKKIEDKNKVNRDKPNYENYFNDIIEGEKCVGYDFDPKRVILIKIAYPEYYILLNNGKKFKIEAWMGDCGFENLEGKNAYKQLPDTCKILIGSVCVSPPPPNCKKLVGKTCLDEEVKQDYQVFQWECTNKGWERMTSFTEYDPDFFEE